MNSKLFVCLYVFFVHPWDVNETKRLMSVTSGNSLFCFPSSLDASDMTHQGFWENKTICFPWE